VVTTIERRWGGGLKTQ